MQAGIAVALEPDADGILERSDPRFVRLPLLWAPTSIGMLEAEPDKALELCYAISAGAEASFSSVEWTGSTAGLLAGSEFRFEAEIGRYLRAVIFRKFLAYDRTLLYNMTLLWVLPTLLRFYTGLYARVRGAESATMDDYYRAVDRVEFSVATHARYPPVFFVSSLLAHVEKSMASVCAPS
jgi:hypothetical protein